MAHVCLVSCTSKKLLGKHKARDLYMESRWFEEARLLAENYNKWFIISAKYGLLGPEEEVEWYDEKLSNNQKENKQWADNVLSKLLPFLHKGDLITIYAGKRYYKNIVTKLEKSGVEVPQRHTSGNKKYELEMVAANKWCREHGFTFDLWKKIADAGT